MPAIYAHYRFGKLVLPAIPADVRGQILRHRQMFDLGLQGPDFLFYYQPFTDSPVLRLGHELHMRSGRDFFESVCSDLHSDSDEAVLAYLYGLLAHYCLDSLCHPFVDEKTASGKPSHTALESEFERYLMAMDGIRKPHIHRRSAYLKAEKQCFETVSRFFPPAGAKEVGEALGGMALCTDLLTCANALHRALAVRILRRIGAGKEGLIVPPAPDPDASCLNDNFFDLYEQALELYPALLEQLRDYLSFREPFGPEFDRIFG